MKRLPRAPALGDEWRESAEPNANRKGSIYYNAGGGVLATLVH